MVQGLVLLLSVGLWEIELEQQMDGIEGGRGGAVLGFGVIGTAIGDDGGVTRGVMLVSVVVGWIVGEKVGLVVGGTVGS